MEGLPKHGQRIKVWPNPAVKVQASATPISDGGRWMNPDGELVTWDIFRHRQLISGELLFHDPRPDAPPPESPLGNEVEIAERRSQAAVDAQARAQEAVAAANRAIEEAEAAKKEAETAHDAALRSSQRLMDKLQASPIAPAAKEQE